jgi:hypothetical protein
MKRDPISNHERPRIVRLVASGQEWQGKRHGHRIRIHRQPQLTFLNESVGWLVCLHHRWHAGFAQTVTQAIEAVNELIRRGGPGRGDVAKAG